MTIEEAEKNVGADVLYIPNHGEPEKGYITSVGKNYVFVRYDKFLDDEKIATGTSRATKPEDLVFRSDWEEDQRWTNMILDQ